MGNTGGSQPTGSGGSGQPPIVSGNEPLVRLDLFGSSLTRGVSGGRFDRAVRRCIVKNLFPYQPEEGDPVEDNDLLNEAILKAIDQSGSNLFHQSIGDLPLAYARATRFGDSKAWVDLFYQRDGTSLNPGSPVDIATFRLTTEYTNVYKKTSVDGDPENLLFDRGLPNGPLIVNAEGEPIPRPYRRPILRIFVTTILNENPLFRTAGTFQKVNKDTDPAFNIGGWAIPQYALRYDGGDVNWLRRDGTVHFFKVDYVFSLNPYGWWRQVTKKTGSTWEVDFELEYDTYTGFNHWPYGGTP